MPLELPHRAAQGRGDFLVAGSNQLAVAWLDKYPAWPGPAAVIHGPPGCGKSHLLAVWSAACGAVRLRGDELSSSEIEGFLNARAIAIDDLESLAEERALFHLYNAMKDAGGHLLLAARRAPAQSTWSLDDLRSRLLAAPAVEVGAPDDELLRAVMAKLFIDRQVHVTPDVISYLLSRMERTFDTARTLVDALDRAALSDKRAITVPLARQILTQSDFDAVYQNGDGE